MALKKGSDSSDVSQLQQKLVKAGYEIEVDGQYGSRTEWAVKNVQAMFGYDVDGIVGPATEKLLDQQLGYGWNIKNDDAQRLALRAQGLLK